MTEKFLHISFSGTELTSLNDRFDESSTIDVMRLYKKKKEQGTGYIEVNRMQLSLLRQIMRIQYRSKGLQHLHAPKLRVVCV